MFADNNNKNTKNKLIGKRIKISYSDNKTGEM